MHRRMVAAGFAVLAVGAVGCGGSSSPPLSQAAFTQRANAICRQRTAQILALQRQHQGDLGKMLDAILGAVSKSRDQLAALKPPASLQHTYAEFMAVQSVEVDRVKQAIAAQKTGQPLNHATSIAVRESRPRLSGALGLPDCA